MRKLDNPCSKKSYCSPIGEYTYDWREKKLTQQSDGRIVELSEPEQRVLEEIFWKRRLVSKGFTLDKPFKNRLGVRALSRRLGVDF